MIQPLAARALSFLGLLQYDRAEALDLKGMVRFPFAEMCSPRSPDFVKLACTALVRE